MNLKHIFFIIAIQFLTLNTVSANEAFEAANEEVVFFDGTILTIPAINSEKQEGAYPRLSHKKLTCLSVEIKVSGESINLSIQA